jgi:hypothetical protein
MKSEWSPEHPAGCAHSQREHHVFKLRQHLPARDLHRSHPLRTQSENWFATLSNSTPRRIFFQMRLIHVFHYMRHMDSLRHPERTPLLGVKLAHFFRLWSADRGPPLLHQFLHTHRASGRVPASAARARPRFSGTIPKAGFRALSGPRSPSTRNTSAAMPLLLCEPAIHRSASHQLSAPFQFKVSSR